MREPEHLDLRKHFEKSENLLTFYTATIKRSQSRRPAGEYP